MRNNDISLSFDPELNSKSIQIKCNKIQIEQVLINLINNSYHAVKDFNPSKRWIRINHEIVDDNILKIFFRDSSHGIPDLIASKIMQPFFTTKEVGQGTGLGLSISKGICKSHGGDF